MSTFAEIQALPAETFPQIGKASDNGNWYIIAPNAIGSTAEKIGPEVVASLVASGVVELATIEETDTGTDATRAVTPAGLAGSALQAKANGASNKITNLLSLTLIGDATNDVKAYALDEWAVYGVIDANWSDVIGTTLVALHIGQGITSIGANAFEDCSTLTGPLTLPDSLLTIGANAFDGCTGVTGNLVIPNSVTAIGNSAFDGNWTATGTLTLGSGLLTIGVSAFSSADFTGNLVIPDSVTAIGANAFNWWTATGTLTLGSGLLTIGDYAFYGGDFTGELIIPSNVTAIDSSAFYNCTGFNGVNLTLPEGLLTTEIYSFRNCTGITGKLTIPSTMTSIGTRTFRSMTGLTACDCYVTQTIVDANTTIFMSCTFSDIHVPATGAVADTWTAGSQTVGGITLNVIKDLT